MVSRPRRTCRTVSQELGATALYQGQTISLLWPSMQARAARSWVAWESQARASCGGGLSLAGRESDPGAGRGRPPTGPGSWEPPGPAFAAFRPPKLVLQPVHPNLPAARSPGYPAAAPTSRASPARVSAIPTAVLMAGNHQ